MLVRRSLGEDKIEAQSEIVLPRRYIQLCGVKMSWKRPRVNLTVDSARGRRFPGAPDGFVVRLIGEAMQIVCAECGVPA